MKTLKIYSALAILVMFFCTGSIFAQGSVNDVPPTLSKAFAVKFPNAVLKKWYAEKTGFVAEAKEGNQKFSASFDQNGNWQNTTSKINWTWKLPSDVRTSLKSGKYSAWRVDGIKKVEMPGKIFYEVCVDNSALQADADHAQAFTDSKVISFDQVGAAIGERGINSPLLF